MERVIYLRYDIAPSCDDNASHMEERILYHAALAVYHIVQAIYILKDTTNYDIMHAIILAKDDGCREQISRLYAVTYH